MPIKDPDKRREYFRELMRKRRAEKKPKIATLAAARRKIAILEAKIASLATKPKAKKGRPR